METGNPKAPRKLTDTGSQKLTKFLDGLIQHYSNPTIVAAVENAVNEKSTYTICAPCAGSSSAAAGELPHEYQPRTPSGPGTPRVSSLKNTPVPARSQPHSMPS